MGYDVWLTNSRGNKYSRGHVNMTTHDKAFWDHTWAEMGRYDVPATIDYILDKTGYKTVSVMAHSQGTTLNFYAMATNPVYYKEKVNLFMGLGPVSRGTRLSPFNQLMYGTLYALEPVMKFFGIYEVSTYD